MMDVLTDPKIENVSVMKCVRSGGTQAVIDNAIGYWIDQDPGPMMVVQPGIVDGRNWSKDHFDTMVRDTAVLRGKVDSETIKDKKNEIMHKTFPGGLLYIIGSNSAAGFRQKTIQRALLDDVDAYDVSASGEGDQIRLARNRTITYMYHNRKIVAVSNPTTRGISRIETLFQASDQRHYFLPCPFCGYSQYLLFSAESQFGHLSRSFLRFDRANLSWAHYECENCHKPIEERYKNNMIRAGKWIPQRPDVTDHAGFHLSEMFSPFSNWTALAKDFIESHRNREQLRVFINQRLGETFVEEKSTELNEDDLRKRCEKYTAVPAGVVVMTAAVDVQQDRLEAIVMGWGKGEEAWVIDRRWISGSTERQSTWDELDEYLALTWEHEYGLKLKQWSTHGISAVCIDSGYNTQTVYRYVKKRQGHRVFAIKGEEGFKKPFVVTLKNERSVGARFAAIAVDAIKVRVFDRLNVERSTDPKDRDKPTTGYIHFPERIANEDFFDQLTSERIKVVRTKQGYPTRKWELKEGRRNEVLDCIVYNFAALALLRPNLDKLSDILTDKINKIAATRDPEEESGEEPPQEEKPVRVAQQKRRPARPQRSWVNDFKL